MKPRSAPGNDRRAPSDAPAPRTPPLLADRDAGPLALILSGGGARGVFQIGVYKTLLEDPRGLGRAPDVISGTSAGAVNGALIAAGLAPEAMLDFWLDLADDPPIVANDAFFGSLEGVIREQLVREPLRAFAKRAREAKMLVSLFRKHKWYARSGLSAMALEFFFTARFDTVSHALDGIQTPYLFDTSPLRDRLRKVLGGDSIRGSAVRLAINTVDVRTGSVIRIVNHRPEKSPRASSTHYRYEPEITLDMIMASAAIPVLFNPIVLDGQHLWDGGLLVNSPMAPAVALGAARIVPVLVTVDGTPAKGSMLGTFGNAIERLVDTFLENGYNVDRKLLLDRNALAAEGRVDDLKVVQLFRAIRPQSSEVFNAGSYLYFDRRAMIAMYEAGRVAARAWLDQGPRIDRRELEG
ncbi:MAG: patatin-like phospholipase family protein [Polyangiaceae bacterium]